MKARVNAAAAPSAAAATIGGRAKNKDKNDPLAAVVEKLTNVCSTLASGPQTTETDYLTTVAAFATVQKKSPMEFIFFDQGKVKGGKVCIQHLTYGCQAGEACPLYHTKQKRICVMYNTKEGCSKKGKCPYGHELIVKDACTAF